jgi:transglutaminase-like putative cysteine protease
MTAANQHIEIDGGILRKQAVLVREASSVFGTAGDGIRADLPGDAFGLLSQGLVVPLATALAARARDLLSSARDLADRVADGVDDAATAFSSVEQDAVDAFARSDS